MTTTTLPKLFRITCLRVIWPGGTPFAVARSTKSSPLYLEHGCLEQPGDHRGLGKRQSRRRQDQKLDADPRVGEEGGLAAHREHRPRDAEQQDEEETGQVRWRGAGRPY